MLAAFKSTEVAVAAGFALLVEGALAALLIWANASASLTPEQEPEVKEVPIAVKPVLDELPLLKLGSKQKARLPDMWTKPKPKPRYEDKTAASTKAEKKLEKPVEKELQKADKAVPPDEEAELAKKVDEEVPEEEPEENEPQLAEEGAADGIKEGTEADPLKAFVISQYRMKVIAWFKAGFSPPNNTCDAEMSVSAQLGPDRSVIGYTIGSPSGNPAFDASVKAHMDRKVGGQVPPPPPKYADILNAVINLRFSGKTSACKSTTPPKGGSQEPSDQEETPPTSLDEPAQPEAPAQPDPELE